MISRITFCFSHSVKIKAPETLEFSPGFNVLAGPNGSGKSTILRALNTCKECEIGTDNRGTIHYFNVETMNPHSFTGAVGNMRNMVLRTRGIFSSHGEIMKVALNTLPIQAGDVLLVDEPEAGQDADGVHRLREGFAAICATGCQVIAASHHPFMWKDARLIEMVPGYIHRVQEEYCRFIGGGD
ncbi:MAG: hypothetical protein EOM20_14810 [Spartobacteria bacterium]|nr:hypothetical protein [Spartobacteria bacterium]